MSTSINKFKVIINYEKCLLRNISTPIHEFELSFDEDKWLLNVFTNIDRFKKLKCKTRCIQPMKCKK